MKRRKTSNRPTKLHRTVIRLDLAGDALPTEFLIWKVGVNTTSNGYDVLWDEEAAAATMAAYEKHGVDLMIDLQHLSLDEEAPNYDPDARGWCKLELRDGELWAVDVRWTPEGAERLRKKKQRYTSPAFVLDRETGRCIEIANIALVAMPGTDELPALVAAAFDRRKLSSGPSMSDIARAIGEALAAKHPSSDPMSCGGPWVCEVYDATIVYELDGKLYEAPYQFDGSVATVGEGVEVRRVYEPVVSPPAEENMKVNLKVLGAASALVRKLHKAGLAPKLILKTLAEGEGGDGSGEVAGVDIAALADFLGIATNPAQDPAGFVKELMSKLDEISSKLRGDAPAAPVAEAPVEEMATEEKKDEMAAARLMRDLMGVATFREGVLRLNDWRAIVRDHEAAAAKVASERAAIELTERTALVKRLQALKAETPHTSGLAEGKLCKRLADEPLSALRERVAVLEAAVGARAPHVPQTASDSTGLSDRELAMCSEMKIDPAQYAATKARRDALRAGKD